MTSASYSEPTFQQRLAVILDRAGYNVLESHMKAINMWVMTTQKDTIYEVINILENNRFKNRITLIEKKPVFSFLSLNQTATQINDIDRTAIAEIHVLDSYLDVAATTYGDSM